MIPVFRAFVKKNPQHKTHSFHSLPISGINVDALYKHLSGYYKKLKKRRKLDAKFEAVFQVIRFYGLYFFLENYALEEEEVYDFILGCAENTALIDLFKKNRHEEVVAAFDQFYSTQYHAN